LNVENISTSTSAGTAADIAFIDNGRQRSVKSYRSEGTIESSASAGLKLEVENLVHEQMKQIMRPLKDQLWEEIKRRKEAEKNLRVLKKSMN